MDTSPFKNTCKISHFKCGHAQTQCWQASSRVPGGGGGYKSNMFSQAWQSPCINHLALQLKTGLASLSISKTTSKQHSSRKFSLVNSNELWVLDFSLFACACLEREFLEGCCVFLSGVMPWYVYIESLLPDRFQWHFLFCVPWICGYYFGFIPSGLLLHVS